MQALEGILRSIAEPAIAVSGGVDSLTLAALAAELSSQVLVMHAVSPAVPPLATERVRKLAAERGATAAQPAAHDGIADQHVAFGPGQLDSEQ